MSDNDITDLPDLASEALGGWAMWANDEFFAAKENLLKPHPAEWREHAYTDQGKWMDGWETRRRREPGSDTCIIRLGLPGVIEGVVVDTAFFRGNYPAECQVEGARIETHYDLRAIHDPATRWTTIVPRAPLKGDAKNVLPATGSGYFTHVKLTIFPDGGVARLRVHGHARASWRSSPGDGQPAERDLDLAALENGARSIACSDMFFGSRHHLILPGNPLTMGGGWETRRRRGEGHDWNIVELAQGGGTIWRAEVDTMHFKGNAPGWCSIDASTDQVDWRALLPRTPLQPHTRHVFEDELRVIGAVTHVRLNVFPDGGVARLRCWGEQHLASAINARLASLNELPEAAARELLSACCASPQWAQAMLRARPFSRTTSLFRSAASSWFALPEAEWLAAFAAHPRIGEKPAPTAPAAHAEWSKGEQSKAGDAAPSTRAELARLNAEYEAKFGFTYLVCATGRSADELLAILKSRLGSTRAQELRTAAEEQARITQLRLRKLLQQIGEAA